MICLFFVFFTPYSCLFLPVKVKIWRKKKEANLTILLYNFKIEQIYTNCSQFKPSIWPENSNIQLNIGSNELIMELKDLKMKRDMNILLQLTAANSEPLLKDAKK